MTLTKEDLLVLGNILDEKIEPLNEKIDALDKKVESLDGKVQVLG